MHGVNLFFSCASYFVLPFYARRFSFIVAALSPSPAGFNRSNSVLLTSVDSITVSCRTSFATTHDYEALVGSAGADVAPPETP
jgi:hypothetical protein